MTEIITSQPSFQNVFNSGKSRVANFVPMIKIPTMFIKTIFKDLNTVKQDRNFLLKCNPYLYFLIQQKLIIFCEKILITAEINRCVTWFMYLLDLIYVRFKCAKFNHSRIYVIYFREAALKRASLNRSIFPNELPSILF